MKPKICPFWKKCGFDRPEGIDCKNYEECHWYGWQIHRDSIALPLTCPIFLECQHQAKRRTCCFEDEDEDDYRTCETFSKWFWKLKAKGK